MTQIISILDSYAYRTLVWDVYVERVARPETGSASDEQKIAAALPKATVCLSALAELMENGPWLTGLAIGLADLHAAQCSRFSASPLRASTSSIGRDG
jgi:glutathione S-transferase